MCGEMEQADISVTLSFPLLFKFVIMFLFLCHKCEPGFSNRYSDGDEEGTKQNKTIRS